ncbi:MAG: HEAT repeat domain-containing protein [Deltaproteobacteria bacterium]|nr:HEAT repeat domain-containing protein [Deltaproteobacteria bacterium]
MATSKERLEFVFRLLASAQERERLTGATELIELAHEPELATDVRPKVLELLANEEPQLRAAGVRCLAALATGTDLVPLLEKAVRDTEPAVRREAARALAGLEERAAIPALSAGLSDSDAQVQFEAALGLAALNDRSGVQILLAGVDDKVRRFFALGALARLGEERAREPAQRILSKRLFMSDFERTQAAGLLAKLGSDDGKAYLLDRIRRARADDRGLAMEVCGELKLKDAVAPLREAMADKRELFRGTAARSLGLLRDADSTTALVAMARSAEEDFEVRCDAMEGLMFLRTPDALAALHALSSSGESDDVRDAANDALSWLQRHPEGGS